SAGGLQLGELVDQLMAYWRDLLVVQCAGTEGRDLSVPPRHHDTLNKHARLASVDAVLAGLDVLSLTRARMRGSNHGRTLVEIALVRLTRLSDLLGVSQLTARLGQPRADPRAAPTPPGAGPRPAAAAPEGVKKKPLSEATTPPPEGPVALDAASLPQLWPQILANVGGML